MATMEPRSAAPQSVTRVIGILEALCADAAPQGLAELSRALGTPKSSLAALLRGLADAGVVVASERGYRLGPAAFGLGSALVAARLRFPAADLIRDGMRRLVARTGETALFAVPDADGETMTYVDVIESGNAVRFARAVGERRPLYCTAGGRALLAAGDAEPLAAYLARIAPRRMAPGTQVDRRAIATAIAAAREAGVAQTFDEASDGVAGTAAAIRDATGAVIGALIVAAPTARVAARGPALAGWVRDEAAAVSKSLGHLPG